MQWTKTLTRSDAQRKRVGNQRGSITLVRAGHQINPQTYFRNQFFGNANWFLDTTSTGETREEAVISFNVEFLGTPLGTIDLTVTYAANREANQANYTSLLHLGPLGSYFTAHNVTGKLLVLDRNADGSYALTIQ